MSLRRWAAAALLAAALPLGAACGDDERVKVDWDVSSSRTLDDVEYPERARDIQGAEVRPEGPVRIALPGGQTFEAPAGEIHRINLERDGEQIVLIALSATRRSVDDAEALARRWAEQFDLPVEPIEAWMARARREQQPTGLSSAPRRAALSPAGPIPSIGLRYPATSEGEQPVVVAMDFFWPPEGSTLLPDRQGTEPAPSPEQ